MESVGHFHEYTYGRRFVLRTDHKPLEFILNPRKGIPLNSAGRLQRWAIRLLGYEFNVEYVPAEENCHADGLSRLPVPSSKSPDEHDCSVNLIVQESKLPFDAALLAVESAKDPLISKCFHIARKGWPRKLNKSRDGDLMPFYHRRNDLSIDQGCLFLGAKLVIPNSLRLSVLSSIHVGHPGISRMKMFAREMV